MQPLTERGHLAVPALPTLRVLKSEFAEVLASLGGSRCQLVSERLSLAVEWPDTPSSTRGNCLSFENERAPGPEIQTSPDHRWQAFAP